MIVNDYKAMLTEAYRVLEAGGVAGFNVWGRRENSQFFEHWPKFLKKYGIEAPPETHTNFHLNDKDYLEKALKEAGFKNPKLFYAPNNKPIFSAETVFEYQASRLDFVEQFKKLSQEEYATLKSDFIVEFNELFGPDTPEPFTFEILVAVAWK